MKQVFCGSCAAMVTPFKDGKINDNVLRSHINNLIDGGTSAIVVAGTTGEPATLSYEERDYLVKKSIEYMDGRAPAIVGSGANSTETAIKLSVAAEKAGANALLVVTPFYNKCTQNGLVAHYSEIAKNTSLPIILYNVPSRTGVNINPDTLAKLSEIKNVVGIKEASGNIDQFMASAKVAAENGLSFYSGDDALTMIAYALGGSGVISVAANVAPKLVSTLCSLCSKGDYEKARELTFKLAPLIKALFCEVNPIPVKAALCLTGIDVGAPRLPLTECEDVHKNELKKVLKDLNLL